MKRTVIRLVIKPYTNKELAPMFNRSERTWRREIAKIRHHLGSRPNNSHWWSINQVVKIMELCGRPYEVIEQDEFEKEQQDILKKAG